MQIYHYSPQTGEYLGSSSAAPDPLDVGQFLVPANATTAAPPTAPENTVARFANEAWQVVEDNRGDYYDFDRNPQRISEIGVPIPPGWTTEPRPDTPGEAIAKQKDAIAAQRYAMETAGIEYQGMTILTDRESVQILDSTCEKIRRGLVPSVDWKCVDGYLTLTSSNIDALEIAILTHVQTAFAWEKAQLESIG